MSVARFVYSTALARIVPKGSMAKKNNETAPKSVYAWIDGRYRLVQHLATKQEYHGSKPAMALRSRVRTESNRELEIPHSDIKKGAK